MTITWRYIFNKIPIRLLVSSGKIRFEFCFYNKSVATRASCTLIEVSHFNFKWCASVCLKITACFTIISEKADNGQYIRAIMTAIWLKTRVFSLDSNNSGHFVLYFSGFALLLLNKSIFDRYFFTFLSSSFSNKRLQQDWF